MTTEPAPAAPVAAQPPPIPPATTTGDEQRLHPWSWLFVVIQYLKQFLLPLLVLLFAGRGDRNELWPIVGVGALALASVWQYFTYRYRLLDDRIEIRSGLIERKLRQIAYARIHNVALHQTPLHRLFGVAEVRLESAGGQKPEAEMRVLRYDRALALEKLVRERGADSVIEGGDVAGADAGTPLLRLDTAEVVRLGLVSNRGMVLVAAGFAALSQISSDLFARWGEVAIRRGAGYAVDHQFGIADYLIAGGLLLVALILLMRLLSVLLALLQYHGFTLSEAGRRLTVSRGLLSRIRSSVAKRRIQAWHLRETVLHRLLRRRSLAVDTAVSAGAQNQQHALRELAPIARPQQCEALIRHLLPNASWPPTQWQPLHRLAWLRIWMGSWLLFALVTVALVWRLGAWGWLALLWLPWSAFLAWKAARSAGWQLHGTLVAVRRGWWSRHWRFAEVDKLQALQLTRSPLDRLFGMRSLLLDTAGANTMSPLHIPYLRPEDAEALRQALSQRLATSALRW